MQRAAEIAERIKLNAYKPSKNLVNDCYNYALDNIEWKDRSSVRLEGESSALDTTLDGVTEHTVSIHLNAKNSFGAYGGPKSVRCEIAGDRVISARYLD